MPIITGFHIHDIAKQQDVSSINAGSVINIATLPQKFTITVSVKDCAGVVFLLDKKTHTEFASPYCADGDTTPLTLGVGTHTIQATAYSDKALTKDAITASVTFTIVAPISSSSAINYPLKGIGSLGSLPSATRDSLVAELRVQGTREWHNHSDRFTVLPTASEFSGMMATIDWVLSLNPHNVAVVTIAREVQVDSTGKVTRTQSRPPTFANIQAWAKAYWAIWKKYGSRVIHNIGNEFDLPTTKSSTSGAVYYQPDPQPSGTNLSDTEWRIKTYMASIQKPFYDTMKSESNGVAVIGGVSFCWNPANMQLAVDKYGYADTCDVGDIHRYATSVNDWISTYVAARKAMKSKLLMCSEWGAAHYNSAETEQWQSNLIASGYMQFATNLDYTFYYMLPSNDKSPDPGLWINGEKAQPLWKTFAELPDRKF